VPDKVYINPPLASENDPVDDQITQ